MNPFRKHLDNLPTHVRDQADAGSLETLGFMLSLVAGRRAGGIAAEMEVAPTDGVAVEYLHRWVSPSFCEHIDRSPNQPGWLLVGLDRDEVKCSQCVARALRNKRAVAKAQADMHCELCGKPTEHFHANAASFPVAVPNGVVSVIAHYEACEECHNAMTEDEQK